MKKNVFIDVSDGSTDRNLQIVLNKNIKGMESSIGSGASVTVSGKLAQTPKGQLELHADNIHVVGKLP